MVAQETKNEFLSKINLLMIKSEDQFPLGINRPRLVSFLHEHLKPYEDTVEDIHRGLDYAFSSSPDKGGFILLAIIEQRLVGALVMLHTGMKGYIPENLLLFVAVEASVRGLGVGEKIINQAIGLCDGDIKLHVEYDNPAKRLYQRLGFTSKYAEMRYTVSVQGYKGSGTQPR